MTIIFIIITLITFIIFYGEAILHYNEGLNEIIYNKKDINSKDINSICQGEFENQIENDLEVSHIHLKLHGKKFYFPNYFQLIKMGLMIILFSSITGLISSLAIKYHLEKNRNIIL